MLSIGEELWQIEIYPNPATEQLTIKSSTKSELLKIEIFDLAGRLIETRELISDELIAKLDLSLLNGFYFVRITNINHEIRTTKLLIAEE